MTNETQGEDFEVIDKRGTEEEAEEQAPIREGVTKKPNVRYQVGMVSGKLEKMGECHRVQKCDPPWIYTKNGIGRDCQWQEDVAMCFKFVPRRCRACWKTVVYPRDIHELIKLKNLQEQMASADPTCLCKCGIELRPEVERNYGGYFYRNSKAGGLDTLKKVRKFVEMYVGEGIKVILKRGCTEMERDYGDSKEWDKFAIYNGLEDEIARNSWINDDFHSQPPLVKDHVVATWLLFAASIADPAFKELSEGESMYPDYSTYEEDDNGSKKETDVNNSASGSGTRNTKQRATGEGKIKVYREKTPFDK
jgi:hypothetical protein